MKRLLVACTLALAATLSMALPTVEQVQAEVAKGRYTQAEEMMREVVAARPDSARAHYVYAEILAHDRRFEEAAAELAKARRIDPTGTYTDRARLDAFSALMEREQAAARRRRDAATGAAAGNLPSVAAPRDIEPPASRGLPGWVWGLGGGLVALIAWRMFSARRPPASPAPLGGYGSSTAMAVPAGGPGGAAGYGPGYGPGYGTAQGSGGGLLGTGLAVAGGVAAGMLAERLLDGHRDTSVLSGGGLAGGLGAGSLDRGGLLPGEIEDPAASELQERSIDFGSGGNDWGSDAGGGSGGSSDDGW